MAKQVYDLGTLHEMLRAKLRSTDGCQNLTDIEIVRVDPREGISNWGVEKFVTTNGEQMPEAAYQVLRAFYGSYICKFPDDDE